MTVTYMRTVTIHELKEPYLKALTADYNDQNGIIKQHLS